jgi:outer membrane protein
MKGSIFKPALTVRRLGAVAMTVMVLDAAGFSADCRAQSLTRIWETTRANEPTLQAAKANLTAAEERTRQALGAMLPQLSATWSKNKNQRNYQQVQANAATSNEKFGTTASAVNLTQPLWRRANKFARTQAEDSQEQVFHQLAATEQDLMARFIAAWFDVMAARDSIRFAVEQAKATKQQLDIFQRGLTLGANSEVQRDEAASKYEQALADKLETESDYQAKIAALEQLAGDLPHFAPPTLITKNDRPFFDLLEPLNFWLSRAETQNHSILSAEKALAAARNEIRKQEAQHEPTVDLVGSISKNDQAEAGNFPGQSGYRTRQNSLGFQVSIPLYSGGIQSAKVREAVALAGKAEFDLESARRAAALQVKQAWAGARTSLGKVAAGRQAITAATTALKAAIAGRATGLKTALEELQARQQFAAARREQLHAMYDNVVFFSKLRAAAGDGSDSLILDLQLALFDDISAKEEHTQRVLN